MESQRPKRWKRKSPAEFQIVHNEGDEKIRASNEAE